MRSLAQMEGLVRGGFAFVQLGRATVRDPDFANHLSNGTVTESDCDQCNRCVASMSAEGISCALTTEEAAALQNEVARLRTT